MKKIIRLTENDLTKLIKRILVESKLNEPKVIKNYYESFDETYSFMFELNEYLNELAPSDEVCNDEHLKMLYRIDNTAANKLRELQKKYEVARTSEKAFADGSVDQKINDFIIKYDDLTDDKFYEFAELFSKEIGIPFEKIKKKRLEFIEKKINPKPSYNENSLKKDPLYIEIQEMFSMTYEWLECCKDGEYICDDDDNGDDNNNDNGTRDYRNYKKPNVKYDSIKGGENVPDKFGVERKKGKEMYEQLKRRIKRYL